MRKGWVAPQTEWGGGTHGSTSVPPELSTMEPLNLLREFTSTKRPVTLKDENLVFDKGVSLLIYHTELKIVKDPTHPRLPRYTRRSWYHRRDCCCCHTHH